MQEDKLPSGLVLLAIYTYINLTLILLFEHQRPSDQRSISHLRPSQSTEKASHCAIRGAIAEVADEREGTNLSSNSFSCPAATQVTPGHAV